MEYVYDPKRVTYFAMTDIRNQKRAFGIRALDRAKHMYVVGKTGMGKSTLLENLAIQDIQHGEGLCFIDPHGSTAEKLLEYVPQDRIKDVIYFAPFDSDNPIGFNVMEDVGYDKRHLVASGLLSAFHRIWGEESWSARMEYILQNTLLALLEYPDTTLADVNRMLLNKKFRDKVLEKIQDPVVKRYWKDEFTSYTEKYKQEAIPGILNKVGQFVANPLTRNIVSQPKSAFDMRDIMDSRKIFIVNLSKGRIGESNADMLGSMIVVKLYLAAMSRADESLKRQAELPPFYLYVDEFQSVVNSSFENILSEARKYKLCLTIAHQYIEQIPEEVRAAVFGNVGTTISFRVGPFDSEVLEKAFNPVFTAEDLVGLGFAQVYLSLMIDGVGSKPFSAQTMPPINAPEVSYHDEIVRFSREKYGTPRGQVEELIRANDIKYSGGGGGQQPQQNQQNQQKKQQPQQQKQQPQQPKQQQQNQQHQQGQNQHKQQPAGQGGTAASPLVAPTQYGTGLTVEDHRRKLQEALSKLSQKERELESKRAALQQAKGQGRQVPEMSVPPAPLPPMPDPVPAPAEPVVAQPAPTPRAPQPKQEVPQPQAETVQPAQQEVVAQPHAPELPKPLPLSSMPLPRTDLPEPEVEDIDEDLLRRLLADEDELQESGT